MKPTFKDWMKEVDEWLLAECGLSSSDLADQTWHDWYDSDMSPEEAGQECLENEGFYDE